MTPRLTASEQAEARKVYLSDPQVSVDALAASYGVGRTVMLRVLDGVTRPRGRREKGDLTTSQMVEMRRQNVTLFEIAKQAGLTESAVSRRIAKAEGR